MLQRYIVFVKSVLRPHINVKHESFLWGFITLLLAKLKAWEKHCDASIKSSQCFTCPFAYCSAAIRIVFFCDQNVAFNPLQNGF